MFTRSLGGCNSNDGFQTGWDSQIEPELTLILQLLLYKYSIWQSGATYGAKLQSLRYSTSKPWDRHTHLTRTYRGRQKISPKSHYTHYPISFRITRKFAIRSWGSDSPPAILRKKDTKSRSLKFMARRTILRSQKKALGGSNTIRVSPWDP